MKLLRYGPAGLEKPGLLDTAGIIRDLSAVTPDLGGEVLSPASLTRLAALDTATLPAVGGEPRLGPPVTGTTNIVCIGLNYADHAAEMDAPIPDEPVIFLKSLGALSGPNDEIVIPAHAAKVDWETELAVVIGTIARAVDEASALDHVAGYALANDVTERGWQYERGGTWDKGKGFDTSAPLGPWLVTKDELSNTDELDVFLDLDGRRMQNGNTRSMIFSIPAIVSYVSQFITLHPGDVICTGTPPGVGHGRAPPVYMAAGQILRCGIARLGEQSHRVVRGM